MDTWERRQVSMSELWLWKGRERTNREGNKNAVRWWWDKPNRYEPQLRKSRENEYTRKLEHCPVMTGRTAAVEREITGDYRRK